MSLDADLTIHIDWDKDGFDAGDEVQAVVMDGSATLGITEPGELSRVAAVGQLTLTLDNADRQFSPGNTGGPHYGKLVHGLPVKVTATIATVVYILFVGTITEWQITSNLYGPRTVTVLAEDKMADFQEETSLALPLQQLCKADDLLRLIGAAVFRCPAATGSFTVTGLVGLDQTVTIGDVTYTFKTTPATVTAPYQVYTGVYAGEATINLYQAINDGNPGSTGYGIGTAAHPQVTATVLPAIGQTSTGGGISIGNTVKLAAAVMIWPGDIPSRTIDRVKLYLYKSGTPLDATVKVVHRDPATGRASSTPVDPNATLTLTAGEVTGVGAWYEKVFPGSFTVQPGDLLVIESSAAASDASNFFIWGNSAANYPGKTETYSYGSTWATLPTTCMSFFVDGVVTLTARARGSYGNAIALTSGAANITASGATLTGGQDGPGGTLDYDRGVRTFEYAADAWGDEQVNAATVIGQIVNAEYGLFVIGRDGQPVFRNGSFLFAAANRPADLVLDNTHSELSNLRVSRADCKNVVSVTYTPRLALTHGVIAQSAGVFRVDPNTAVRWSASVPAAPSTLKLPFKDAAGNSIGALDVDTLIAGTHYRVNDRVDGTGFDYTNTLPQRVWASWVITASGIEITFRNDAIGALYILDLQVTGTGLSPFSTETVTAEDAASISLYGRLPDEYQLDLPVVGPFPSALASYLLSRQKDPRLLFDGAVYDTPGEAGSTHLFALELLDLVEISDEQSGVSSQKCLVTGAEYRFSAGDVSEVTLHTRPVPPLTYWQLGHSTFGKLGTSTRLAL